MSVPYLSNNPRVTIKGTVPPISDFYNWMNYRIRLFCPKSTQDEYYKWRLIGQKVLEVASSLFNCLKSIYDIITNSLDALKESSKGVGKIFEHIGKIKIFSFFSIPENLYDLAMDIKNIAKGVLYKNVNRVVEGSFALLGRMSNLTSIIGLSIEGLANFGKIPYHCVEILPASFYGVSTVLSVFSIGLNIFYLANGFKAQSSIKRDVTVIPTMKKRDIRQYIGVSEAKELQVRLSVVKDDNMADVKDTVLRRVKLRNVEHGLKVLAGTISLIASMIFLFAPFIAPVAFGLYAISSAIGLSAFIVNKVANHRMMKAIKIHAPDDDPKVSLYLQEQSIIDRGMKLIKTENG